MFITRVCSGVSFFQTDPAPLLFLDGVLFSTQPHVKTPQLLSSVLKVSPSRKINNALHSVKTTLTELFNCKDYNELYSSKYIHCLCFHLEFNMQLGFKTMTNTNIWQKQQSYNRHLPKSVQHLQNYSNLFECTGHIIHSLYKAQT